MTLGQLWEKLCDSLRHWKEPLCVGKNKGCLSPIWDVNSHKKSCLSEQLNKKKCVTLARPTASGQHLPADRSTAGTSVGFCPLQMITIRDNASDFVAGLTLTSLQLRGLICLCGGLWDENCDKPPAEWHIYEMKLLDDRRKYWNKVFHRYTSVTTCGFSLCPPKKNSLLNEYQTVAHLRCLARTSLPTACEEQK